MEGHIRKLKNFYDSHKRMPSYTEMMRLFGYASKNAVARVIEKLVDAGVVEKDSTGRIVPKNLISNLRVLGLVEAGFPTPAEEDTLDTMTLDEFMIKNASATYMLEVKGDSMIDAGIHEGDYVIVERTENYRVGDIVIAEIDGEWTMKYLRRQGNFYYLEAANSDYPDLHPAEDLKISAVVRGVVRKYDA